MINLASKPRLALLLMIGLSLVTLMLSPFIGIEIIGLQELLQPSSTGKIFWNLRVPRTLLAFIAGASLAFGWFIISGAF